MQEKERPMKLKKAMRYICTAIFMILFGMMLTIVPARADQDVAIYRMYNRNSGEHFYTPVEAEKEQLQSAGWRYEGVGWYAPSTSDKPVYRLYNPNAGDHHYTQNVKERDALMNVGWNDEGICWYSDPDQTVPLYRLYNPNAHSGAHHYTTNIGEQKYLQTVGWKAEGVGWYATKPGYSVKISKIVCIDPGHQDHGMPQKEPIGPGSSVKKTALTSGAYGKWSKKNEYEVNLEVGLLLKAELESRGYTVVMTRTTNQVNLSNRARAQIAADAHADIFLRLHCNDIDSGSGVRGVLAYVPSLRNPYLSKNVITESRRLGDLLVKYQARATGQKTLSSIEGDDMTGINWASMPVSIVEMGFMSNPTEDRNLGNPDFQKKIAIGLADGVDEYFR